MNEHQADTKLIRWFYQLPVDVRYRFCSQWMADEAMKVSNAKLAECLVGEKSNSESLIKGFRSFDLKNQKFKKVWRPESGFTDADVHLMCHGINAYRQKNGRNDKVSVAGFYERARDELCSQYPLSEQKTISATIEPIASPTKELPIEKSSIKKSSVEQMQVEQMPVMRSLWRPSLITYTKILALILIVVVFYIVFQRNTSVAPQIRYQQYLPGNVVQLRQVNNLGRSEMLTYPEHYLDAKHCYPSLESVGEVSAISSADQLKFLPIASMDDMTNLLPNLGEKQSGLHSVDIGFDAVTRWHVTKGMINLGMSEVCLSSMQQVVDYGNKVDDYGIIKQTFVADDIQFDLVFSVTTDPQIIKSIVTTIMSHYSTYHVEAVSKQDKQKIVHSLIINGPVAIGYVSQPMSARMSR